MNEHAVVIVGGGPTGLMLAAELALARVDVAIVERRETPDIESARAGGLHARTLELLDQRGIVDRFLSQGQPMQIASFGGVPLDISDFPTRHNHGLALWQKHIERLLAEWVATLPVTIYRGREARDCTQDAAGVRLDLAGGAALRGKFLVGCDGGRSVIRKKAGIDFPGWAASISYLIAEAEMTEPAYGMRRDEKGTIAIGKLDDGLARIVLREDRVADGEPTLDDLKSALVGLYGRDFDVRNPRWLSRFSDMTRQAASCRAGRVLLAGDAAHVHSPMGGQGLNLGLQEAVNLGWKLAQVIRGDSPDSLLDTYQAERHPVAARALRTTMAQTALSRGDDRMDAVRESVADLLKMDEPRRRYAGMLTGLDIQYACGPASSSHPLLGRRMPDLDLPTTAGTRPLYTFLHGARPLLLHLGRPGECDVSGWQDRVPLVEARYAGPWELPVIGAVDAPMAVLIRPDGHVAWVGEGSHDGLAEALTFWFGAPR